MQATEKGKTWQGFRIVYLLFRALAARKHEAERVSGDTRKKKETGKGREEDEEE